MNASGQTSPDTGPPAELDRVQVRLTDLLRRARSFSQEARTHGAAELADHLDASVVRPLSALVPPAEPAADAPGT